MLEFAGYYAILCRTLLAQMPGFVTPLGQVWSLRMRYEQPDSARGSVAITRPAGQHTFPTRLAGGTLLVILTGIACASCARSHASWRQTTSTDGQLVGDVRAGTVGACNELTPAAVGGPMPKEPVLTLRWLGTTNFELAFGQTVALLDAYYDRGPRNRPVGVSPADMSRADLILIGHGHSDHIADAAAIAKKTGAIVVGAPLSIQVVLDAGLPRGQTRTVTGQRGELLRFPDFSVEPVLAQHSVLSRPAMAKFREIVGELLPPPTADELEAERVIEARGSSDPRVQTEGTLAFVFTFKSGFRLLFLDSAGPITEAERQLMRRIEQTDVAIVAYQGQYLAEKQMAITLPLIKLFRPRIYIPAHHDALAGYFPDLGIEPLFMAIRDELPGTRTIAPLYRAPICLSVQTQDH